MRCSSLENVSLPNTLTYLGQAAFQDCISLQSINLPGSLLKIADYTFNKCDNLESVVIDSGVETIGWGAFDSCSSLVKVSIPDTVSKIESYAFKECSSLKTIEVEEEAIIEDSSFPETTEVKRRKGDPAIKEAKLKRQAELEKKALEQQKMQIAIERRRKLRKWWSIIFCILILSLGTCWYLFYVINWGIIWQILWFLFVAPLIVVISILKL